MGEQKEKKKGWTVILQFVKFGLVGVSNTVISWCVYALAIRLGAHYSLATLAGFIISVLNAFYWNNKYVFSAEEGERVWWKALLRTYIAYGATGLVLNEILLYFWLDMLHVENMLGPLYKWFLSKGIQFKSVDKMTEYIAPVFNYCITIPLNFILNKFWAYGGKGKKETS